MTFTITHCLKKSKEQKVLIESLSQGIVSASAVYIDFTCRKLGKIIAALLVTMMKNLCGSG